MSRSMFQRTQAGPAQRRMRAFATTAALALLTACHTTPSAPPAAASKTPSKAAAPISAPASHATLPEEQRRLAALFQGTPVVFAMQPDGSLLVEVPLRYCFDPGLAVVKAPLAAVLDRVAKSQKDEGSTLAVTGPVDAGAKTTQLGADRAFSARDYLAARGIAVARFSLVASAPRSALRIVITGAAPH